jgi:hypothetical protein
MISHFWNLEPSGDIQIVAFGGRWFIGKLYLLDIGVASVCYCSSNSERLCPRQQFFPYSDPRTFMGFLRSSLLYVEDSISLNTSKVAS